MKDALLSTDNNINVIAVDWKAYSDYTVATANTQVVGVEISLLLAKLVQEKGIKPKDVHLIGHSLGAHISGIFFKL